jgi:hypothetical protein
LAKPNSRPQQNDTQKRCSHACLRAENGDGPSQFSGLLGKRQAPRYYWPCSSRCSRVGSGRRHLPRRACLAPYKRRLGARQLPPVVPIIGDPKSAAIP